MEPAQLEQWGADVVDRAAELVVAAVPAEQQPTIGERAPKRPSKKGYVARHVHLRRPDRPEQRAVWLFVVAAGHAYNRDRLKPRMGAGLLQDVGIELDPVRFAAGLPPGGAFQWREHVDKRYEGYRLFVDLDPDAADPHDTAAELADRVIGGMRRARLID